MSRQPTIQFECNSNPIQMQFECNSNLIRIQFEFEFIKIISKHLPNKLTGGHAYSILKSNKYTYNFRNLCLRNKHETAILTFNFTDYYVHLLQWKEQITHFCREYLLNNCFTITLHIWFLFSFV